MLYDYYNPEALVALPPADFNVQARPQSGSENYGASLQCAFPREHSNIKKGDIF